MIARPPKCAGYMYRSITRFPFRNKFPNNRRKTRQVTDPGDCVSIYQLKFSTTGFIAHMKNVSNKQRYGTATFSSDHYIDLRYMHIQKILTYNETVQSKKSFESYIQKVSLNISHYHAQNGRFQDNMFV